jgi:hypothetical protein
METAIELHQLAESAPCAPGAADAARASAPDSTTRPPASTGAAYRDGPSRRLHWPDARRPASAQTARPPVRCTSPERAPTPARARPSAAHDSMAPRPPMFQALRPFRSIPPHQTLRLAIAHGQHRRRRSHTQLPAFTRLNTSTRVNSRALIHVLPSGDLLRGHQLRGHFYFAREGTLSFRVNSCGGVTASAGKPVRGPALISAPGPAQPYPYAPPVGPASSS